MSAELHSVNLEQHKTKITESCDEVIALLQAANAQIDRLSAALYDPYFATLSDLKPPNFKNIIAQRENVRSQYLHYLTAYKERNGEAPVTWLDAAWEKIAKLIEEFLTTSLRCITKLAQKSIEIRKNIEDLLSAKPQNLLETESLLRQLHALLRIWKKLPLVTDKKHQHYTEFHNTLKHFAQTEIFIEKTHLILLERQEQEKKSKNKEQEPEPPSGEEKKIRPPNISSDSSTSAPLPKRRSPKPDEAEDEDTSELKPIDIQRRLEQRQWEQALKNIRDEEKKEKTTTSGGHSKDDERKRPQEPQDNKNPNNANEFLAEYFSSQENLLRAFTEYVDALDKFPLPTIIPNLLSLMDEHLAISLKVKELNLPGNLDFEMKKTSNQQLLKQYIQSSAITLIAINEKLTDELNRVASSTPAELTRNNQIVSAITTYETTKQKLILLSQFTTKFILSPPILELTGQIDDNINACNQFLFALEQVVPELMQATIASLNEPKKPSIAPISAASVQENSDQTTDDDDDKAQELAAIALSLSLNKNAPSERPTALDAILTSTVATVTPPKIDAKSIVLSASREGKSTPPEGKINVQTERSLSSELKNILLACRSSPRFKGIELANRELIREEVAIVQWTLTGLNNLLKDAKSTPNHDLSDAEIELIRANIELYEEQKQSLIKSYGSFAKECFIFFAKDPPPTIQSGRPLASTPAPSQSNMLRPGQIVLDAHNEAGAKILSHIGELNDALKSFLKNLQEFSTAADPQISRIAKKISPLIIPEVLTAFSVIENVLNQLKSSGLISGIIQSLRTKTEELAQLTAVLKDQLSKSDKDSLIMSYRLKQNLDLLLSYAEEIQNYADYATATYPKFLADQNLQDIKQINSTINQLLTQLRDRVDSPIPDECDETPEGDTAAGDSDEENDGKGLQGALALSRTGSTSSEDEVIQEGVSLPTDSVAMGKEARSVQALIQRGGPLERKTPQRPATPPPVAESSTEPGHITGPQ